jgi:hypothetical protein
MNIQDYVEGNRGKQKGTKQKDRQEQSEAVEITARSIVILYPRSRNSPRLLGQGRCFKNTRLKKAQIE